MESEGKLVEVKLGRKKICKIFITIKFSGKTKSELSDIKSNAKIVALYIIIKYGYRGRAPIHHFALTFIGVDPSILESRSIFLRNRENRVRGSDL